MAAPANVVSAGHTASAERGGEGQLAKELSQMQWEPLLPAEKKLIGWSIGLGVALLGVLVWISYNYFPAGH